MNMKVEQAAFVARYHAYLIQHGRLRIAEEQWLDAAHGDLIAESIRSSEQRLAELNAGYPNLREVAPTHQACLMMTYESAIASAKWRLEFYDGKSTDLLTLCRGWLAQLEQWMSELDDIST
jgi:hypothetical protein